MIKSAIFSILLYSTQPLFAQNFQMTFKATGVAGAVDSVTATNLQTNKSITLPGNETLILYSPSTLISTSPALNRQGIIYPNPCTGKATAVFYVSKDKSVLAEVFNMAGQRITGSMIPVQSGEQAFSISFSKAGMYLVRLTDGVETANLKIICQRTSEAADCILYTGSTQGHGLSLMKKAVVYSLGYESGDILFYLCKSGKHKTVITDSPDSSKNYSVEFVLCEDPDGKNYPIVKIGTQTWMAENLAWLPSVTPSSKGSDSLKRYYVYDFEDTVILAAKGSAGYKQYGTLYNWPAAMNADGKKRASVFKTQGACPGGWHIPEDDEWKVLEKNLYMSQSDADTLYLRNSNDVGGKLKSSLLWFSNGNGSNFSGFTALPGGYRNTHGGFFFQKNYSLYWSASTSEARVWYRSLYFQDKGVYRCATMKGHALSVRCVRD